MRVVVESLIMALITKNPLMASLIGSVVLGVVGFVWTARPFFDYPFQRTDTLPTLLFFLAFMSAFAGLMAFVGMEAWPSVLTLGGITRVVTRAKSDIVHKIPSLKKARLHMEAFDNLCIGYRDEREIHDKHEKGELGYFGGALTYLRYEAGEREWWILGLDVMGRPSAAVALATLIVCQPILMLLRWGTPVENNFFVSLGTAFLANMLVVGSSLCVLIILCKDQHDRKPHPTPDETSRA
jgi:hypothetical protein